MYHAQTLVPDRPFHPSFSQVSWPGSPGRGTDWNSHSFFPVRASYARVLPGGPVSRSPVLAPTVIRSPKTVGTPLYGTTISTLPSFPKPGSVFPVVAFRAISMRPAVNRMRDGFSRSPGHQATPRGEAWPEGTL